jgi:hypothetical protein
MASYDLLRAVAAPELGLQVGRKSVGCSLSAINFDPFNIDVHAVADLDR